LFDRAPLTNVLALRAAARPTSMPKITYLPTGAVVEVAAGARFIDVCRDQNLPHPFGCTVGSCGTCCSVIKSGYDNCAPPSDDERETIEMCTAEKNARLGCQLVVRGDVALQPVD
jgi:ferredoxin